MIALIMYILTITGSDLDDFIEKDIRIFFSHSNHIFLGLDVDSSKVVPRSKYSSLKSFVSAAQIIPNEEKHRIQFDSHPICADKSEVIKCSISTNWIIKKSLFGFTISDGSKCIPIVENDAVKMMPCLELNDQIVDFKLTSDDQNCGINPKEPENKYCNKKVLIVPLHESSHNRSIESRHYVPRHTHHRHIRRYSPRLESQCPIKRRAESDSMESSTNSLKDADHKHLLYSETQTKYIHEIPGPLESVEYSNPPTKKIKRSRDKAFKYIKPIPKKVIRIQAHTVPDTYIDSEAVFSTDISVDTLSEEFEPYSESNNHDVLGNMQEGVDELPE